MVNDKSELPPWRRVILDAHLDRFAESARGFYRSAVEPICDQMALGVGDRPMSNDHAEHHAWEGRRTVQMETHRSFALGLGALWERNIREHLAHSASLIVKPISNGLQDKIVAGGFKGIEGAWKTVRGFPLSWFSSYQTLRQVALASSAIRHGDGCAATKLQREWPHLFLKHGIEVGSYAYFTFGGNGPDAVRKLDITKEHLAGFAEAIGVFWDEVRELASNAAPL